MVLVEGDVVEACHDGAGDVVVIASTENQWQESEECCLRIADCLGLCPNLVCLSWSYNRQRPSLSDHLVGSKQPTGPGPHELYLESQNDTALTLTSTLPYTCLEAMVKGPAMC